MTIDIITLFPDMFKGPFSESMVNRAIEKNIVTIGIHNLRKWTIDSRGTVDGHPYGGGVGMLLRPEPVFNAVDALKQNFSSSISDLLAGKAGKFSLRSNHSNQAQKVVLLDAGGKLYKQDMAVQYSKLDHIILICGHYEGVDYRVHEMVADDIISVGDYVLTGGEIPAMVVTDSIVRLLPGVLNKQEGTEIESFTLNYELQVTNYESKKESDTKNKNLLEFPQYTRPEEFQGHKVPEILLGGHHGEIEKWRREKAIARTEKYRPDLLK